MKPRKSLYHRHRFPQDIICHAVWLYFRFCLSYRDVEDLLAERGIKVSYETVRRRCNRFDPIYANRLRKRSGPGGDQRFVTDKLRSYAAARREVMPNTLHDTSQYANNRAELSHEPTRQRERTMRGFKSMGQAQRFLTVHGTMRNLFGISRHLLMRAKHYRLFRTEALDMYQQVTCA